MIFCTKVVDNIIKFETASRSRLNVREALALATTASYVVFIYLKMLIFHTFAYLFSDPSEKLHTCTRLSFFKSG